MTDLSKVNWKGPQPAPKHLAKRLRVNFPQITRTGIYNDRNVAGTNKKSSHAEGLGLDIHLSALDPGEGELGDQLYQALIRRARELGIDNVIWNRQIWSQSRGGPRQYTGVNAHTDHLHVEFTRAGSQNRALEEIEVDIATIRTGFEDLGRSSENMT
jgi:hypothetical protein